MTLPVPFERQALHAYKLGLVHPETGRKVSWEAEPPEDMQDLIEALDFEGYAARQLEDDDDDFDDDDDHDVEIIYVKDDDDD
ncbi:Ribosomal large subunit pseudouridine synthase D [compost metagenome]